MHRRLAVTVIALLVVVGPGGVTACSSPSTVGVLASGHPSGPDDAFAPPTGTTPSDDPNEARRVSRRPVARPAAPGDAPSPAVTSVDGGGAASAVDSGATAGTTPGEASAASQRPGRGYVDTLAENRLPGTPGWQAARSGREGVIEGYADLTSTVAGQPVRLYVSSTARTFRVQLLRLGWYGGVGARQVWMSVPLRGGLQAAARTDPVTRMVSAPWTVSAVLPTEGLVAGDYVAKLLGSDGASSFVPVVVRELRSSGAVLMLGSTLTWLAYNSWGGANTYTASGASTRAQGYAQRSVVASYDRPYAQGSGAGGLFEEEYNLVLVAERLGLPLNYAADIDLHTHPEVMTGAVGVVLLGHSEYWSRSMRAVLTAARDAGVNLAFLGANDLYRRIRLQPSPTGAARQMVNYKDGTADPVTTEDTTADWPHRPFGDPESSLTGVQYRCARARADLVVTDPDAWVFRGLGLRPGQRLPGLVGSEFDRVSLGVPTPRPIQIMAHSPVSCYGYPEFSDVAWYTTPSGAGVFAAGTLDWNHGVAGPDPLTRTVVTTATERVLRAMATPQAGRQVPAADNAGSFYTPAGVPIDPKGRLVPQHGPNAKNPTAT